MIDCSSDPRRGTCLSHCHSTRLFLRGSIHTCI